MKSSWSTVILLMLCMPLFNGCPKAEDVHELVGSWEMIKYTSIIGGVITVEEGETLEQDSLTIEFREDNTYKVNSIENGESYIFTGSWSTNGDTLIIISVDEDVEVSEEQLYSISSNILTLEWVESSYSTHIWEYRRK